MRAIQSNAPLAVTSAPCSYRSLKSGMVCVKLGDESTSPKHIFTEMGVDYRMGKGEGRGEATP